MIVVDASVAVEVVLRTDLGQMIAGPLLDADDLACPHLIDVEVAQALRRVTLGQDLAPDRAQQALTDFAALPLERYPHEVLLSRIWQLRHNFTAYDAAYVALAEALSAPLWTCDLRMARSAEELIKVQPWPLA